MKMELLDNGCLKVLLTEEDLQALGLTFDSMDTTNMATQEAIQSLLLTARHETGFDPSMGLVVEALPVDGGCLLLFTPVCTRRRIRLKKAIGPYIYEAEDTEQLFRLADGLCHHQLTGSPVQPWTGSSLYQFGDKYRLVLYPSTSLPQEMGNLLQEFVHTAGEGDAAAAYTAEHGKAIVIGDALLRLCMAVESRGQNGQLPRL